MEVLQSKEIRDYIDKNMMVQSYQLSKKDHFLNAYVKRVIFYLNFILLYKEYLHRDHRIPFDNQILRLLYLILF